MDGADAWDNSPTAVIKGVYNMYADSHKAKGWQKYASATVIAYMKALLSQWSALDQPHSVQSGLDESWCWTHFSNEINSGLGTIKRVVGASSNVSELKSMRSIKFGTLVPL
ncbi:hypothetical protein J3F84DRAFT_379797 [Trichoderma pleuroticola]